jgi:CRP-like cAMP-binding protein
MHHLAAAIRRRIAISGEEMEGLLRPCFTKIFKKQEELSRPGPVPNDIFFINRGILRVIVLDKNGTEHTVHFAMENQFIADYPSFMLHSTPCGHWKKRRPSWCPAAPSNGAKPSSPRATTRPPEESP